MNSFTSVSANPPLVLTSVARKARCHGYLAARPFCVNILGAEQEQMAALFAGMPALAAATEPQWVSGARVPRLVNPLAWVECEPWRSYDGGDHTLVLGLVTDLGHKLYQRFPQILRKLGASGLMATPTEADIHGPAAVDIETYLQSATLSGPDRVRLFRLAWDTCISAFSGRQALYEYDFFGDPVRMAGAYVASYDREPYKARVRAFSERS